jgi:hypothetical protein
MRRVVAGSKHGRDGQQPRQLAADLGLAACHIVYELACGSQGFPKCPLQPACFRIPERPTSNVQRLTLEVQDAQHGAPRGARRNVRRCGKRVVGKIASRVREDRATSAPSSSCRCAARASLYLDAGISGVEEWALRICPWPMGTPTCTLPRMDSRPVGVITPWLVLGTRPLGVLAELIRR